jgi:hypothetical protein
MPLILNVGLAKELRQPDGGSVGASCNVRVELDAALWTGDPDAFHRRVRNAYAACRQAVNRELARQTTGPSGNGAHGVIRRKPAHAQPISQAVATKRVLLDEALELDDLNDRMASALDDLDA